MKPLVVVLDSFFHNKSMLFIERHGRSVAILNMEEDQITAHDAGTLEGLDEEDAAHAFPSMGNLATEAHDVETLLLVPFFDSRRVNSDRSLIAWQEGHATSVICRRREDVLVEFSGVGYWENAVVEMLEVLATLVGNTANCHFTS